MTNLGASIPLIFLYILVVNIQVKEGEMEEITKLHGRGLSWEALKMKMLMKMED